MKVRLKYESNEKLRRALRHNIRETEGNMIEIGDKVYYKRNNNHEWHGPGTVIGRDGKQFLVRHGGVYVRVHECRLTNVNVSSVGDNNHLKKINSREKEKSRAVIDQ